ncbi:murein L,D-transpeptidase catalytic domain family protein [Sphingomonas sp. ID0503]|uniref:murein L,D-transpeptidase catalytic domain family protein n=1 Tax=Sphingomonas sp. ID0503 TaxID=3399691 RepID=UPI003AFB11E2
MTFSTDALSRRAVLGGGVLAAGGLIAGQAMAALPAVVARKPTVRPELMRRALMALERHGKAIPNRDVIGVADFSVHSATPRFHFVNLASGETKTMLVSHGRGSDPAHSGMLQRFSNEVGSAASSQGAYRTDDLYVGKHGRSRRLTGLDITNNNAEPRAVVVHGAWYANPDVIAQHGKLGRSEGCFAFAEAQIEEVLARLGAGRMIYAEKV